MNFETKTSGTTTSPSKRTKRPRKQVVVACNRCRRLKTKCDNARPTCAVCRHRNVKCEYDTEDPSESRSQAVQRQYSNLQDLYHAARDSLVWLGHQSEGTALSCLQRLKGVEDPVQELCTIVAAERSQRLAPGLSTTQNLFSSSPLVKDTLTAELSIRYPLAFPWLPEQESATPQQVQLDESSRATQYKSSKSPSLLKSPHSSPSTCSRSPPGPVAQTIRSRLQSLTIGFWTTVPISNETAIDILATYLQVEHPIYGFFDHDLFLDHLLTHQVQYCSPLLVNSLLFWACCTYGPIFPGTYAFARHFLEASQKLLEAEHDSNSPLNVASFMILSLGAICFGRDQLAKMYLVAGIRMAEELFLIGECRRSVRDFAGISTDALSMLSHIAWGAFNFSSVYLLHFHDVQSGTYTKRPPLLPIPNARSCSNENDPPNKIVPHPTSADQSTTFPYFCRFWCIAHEIGTVLYSSPGPVYQHVPLAFAESKFHKLLEWAQSLPPEAARSEAMTHNVAEMHICLHATIMDLFRPFLAKEQVLSSFATSPRRPEAIFALSLGHLHALTRYYHTSFAGLPESHTISWVHGPLYVAPAILHYDRSEGWETKFLHCIEACSDLMQSHKALEGFLRALLGMAVVAGAFTVAQATAYLSSLQAVREGDDSSEVPDTGFIVDQNLAMESRVEGVGHTLAQRFDEMLFWEDPFDFT